MSATSRPKNRLAGETSPYLLQHARNPVDWYPWGPDALARARDEDKPILLSVGYSACHWCHVMERESFEDETTAAEMNRGFINIKVDREERPDLDELYMRAVQAFTGGHGGWPMTVFLTPDGEPFFGGMYFPDEPRHGMPSFRQILDHVSRIWTQDRDRVGEISADVVRHLREDGGLPPPADALAGDLLPRVSAAMDSDYDETNAGFGGAPKFPAHGTLDAILAHAQCGGDKRARQMVMDTLKAMAQGGMYDLAGGGFARYSVDAEWRIPHFEKMLYDNALLVPVYVDAYRMTGVPWARRVAVETCEFVIRELGLPGGGFASALDADTDGEEGRFYVWTPRELRDVLGLFDGTRVAALCEVTDDGTFEHGTSVLRLALPLEQQSADDQALLARALPMLLNARQARTHPGRDDKLITGWNALMIGALARAGAALGEAHLVAAAERAAEFILSDLVIDGRLQRTWKDGRGHVPAFADDHAALCGAFIDLWEATADPFWLSEANGIATRTVELFWDSDDGGLFYAGHDAEELVARSKKLMGGAEPTANALAALAFAKLSVLSGRTDLRDHAELLVRQVQPLVDRAPRALGLIAIAGAWLAQPTEELAIIGRHDDPHTQALITEARSRFRPLLVTAVVAPEDAETVQTLLPWIAKKGALNGAPTAYLCAGFACRQPVQTPAELGKLMDGAAPTTPTTPTREPAPELPTDPASWLNARTPPSITSLQGQVVVLDFWTQCCINCMHVLPELAAVERTFEGRPVTIIGVHSGKFPAESEHAAVARAVQRHDIHHPVVHDPQHSVWKAYGVRSWPTIVVLDATGRIAWRQEGEVDRVALGRVVTRLLAEGKEAGTLGQALPPQTAPSRADSTLQFPGKVAVYPPAVVQEKGADPLSGGGWIYVADTGHHRILEAKVGIGADGWPDATVTRTWGDDAGLADGDTETARFRSPQGLDRSGSQLFVADTENHAIRRIDLDTGHVTTVAGTGTLGRGGEPIGKPTDTALRSPWDVAVAGPEHGAARPEELVVFIAMAGTHQLWALLPSQDRIAPMAGTGTEDHIDGPPTEAALAQPSGLSLFGRYLFFADSEVSSVRFVDLQARQVGTLAGAGLFDFGDVDGSGGDVRMQHPLDVTVAEDTVWVADTYNHKIKGIGLKSQETKTLLGGDPAVLCEPGGIARLGGYLLVADTGNHRLRIIRRATGETRDLVLTAPRR
jgi:uncharacterized protein